MKPEQSNPTSQSAKTEQSANISLLIGLGITTLVVVIIGGLIVLSYSQESSSDSEAKDDHSNSMMQSDSNDDSNNAMHQDSKNSDNSDSMMKDDQMMSSDSMTKGGIYTDYSSDLLANAEAGEVVIFFNASWCPTCQATVKDIRANESSIASNLTILSADFDKETSLKKKYNITTQHSFVKVDKDGNEIKKAVGLDTLDAIEKFAQ